MTAPRRRSTQHWLQHFRSQGHDDPEPIGFGIEGTVYRLTPGTIAKVWHGTPPNDLGLIGDVYADIATNPPPFATPRILRTETCDGTLISYEPELTGAPARPDSALEAPTEREIPETELDIALTVLRGLATVPGTAAMRKLTVRGDDRPLWPGYSRFPDALAALVRRAVDRHHAVLAARVPDLTDIVDRTVRALHDLPDTPVSVIHGDLVPPNIHIDTAGRVTAVLDFGFFTTAGDPAFEAAVAAATWDMYGPHARLHADTLTGRFAAELGHPVDTLRLYQTCYALCTYDLFTSDGSDGHFGWCADLLRDGR